jgi:hypothetical protein
LDLEIFELVKNRHQVAMSCPGRAETANLRVETEKAHRVMLSLSKVTQGSSQETGVIDLADSVTRIAHTRAGVQKQENLSVGVTLELFHVETVTSAIDLPIHPPDIVSWAVLTVLCEFEAETVIGRTVQSGDESLNDSTGYEMQIGALPQ